MVGLDLSHCITVWKFQDFSVTHILREINFSESTSSTILTNFPYHSVEISGFFYHPDFT